MSDKAKNFFKRGWHPEDSGGIRKQVGGILPGRSKVDAQSARAQTHQSRPLAALQDPDSFGPPPKNRQFHPDAAVESPDAPAPRATGFSSRPSVIAPAQAEQASPVSEATGAAAAQTAQSVRQRFDSPKPLVRNTSGLSTEGLPPPPVRRERPPFIRQGSSQRDPRRNVTRPTVAASLRSSDTQDGDQAASPKPMPRLPPRLPPRTASAPRIMPPDYSADADPENGILSQSSSRNLAAAGIYVPGLDIDLSLSSRPQPQAPGRSMPPPKPTPQISELRSLFSRQTLTSNQPPSPASQPATTTTLTDPSSTTPSQGTTWAQKQAALRTASTFHKDPTSVSLADTRAAASVATNFRDRHGGQVKTGVGAANTLNQKYGLAGRVGAFAGGKAGGGGGGGVDGAPGSEGGAGTVEGAGAVARVPPSVPRRNVIAAAGGGGAPPPVPLASRPR